MTAVVDGRSARGCGQRSSAAFKCGQPFFQDVVGRVREARVDVAHLLERKEAGRVFRALEHVAGRAMDRERPGERPVECLVCVKAQRFEMGALWHISPPKSESPPQHQAGRAHPFHALAAFLKRPQAMVQIGACILLCRVFSPPASAAAAAAHKKSPPQLRAGRVRPRFSRICKAPASYGSNRR